MHMISEGIKGKADKAVAICHEKNFAKRKLIITPTDTVISGKAEKVKKNIDGFAESRYKYL